MPVTNATLPFGALVVFNFFIVIVLLTLQYNTFLSVFVLPKIYLSYDAAFQFLVRFSGFSVYIGGEQSKQFMAENAILATDFVGPYETVLQETLNAAVAYF